VFTMGSLWFNANNTVTETFRFRLMIVDGNFSGAPLSYEPYHVPTIIPLPTLGEGDTYNVLTGAQTAKRAVKVFDGTEAVALYPLYNGFYANVLGGPSMRAQVIAPIVQWTQ